jgi:hypothetical protein
VNPDSVTVSPGMPALPGVPAQELAGNLTPWDEGPATALPSPLAAPNARQGDPGLPTTTGSAWSKVLVLAALAALTAVGAMSRLLVPSRKPASRQQLTVTPGTTP